MPTIQAFLLITSILAAHLINDREREVAERASGSVVVTLSAESSRVARLPKFSLPNLKDMIGNSPAPIWFALRKSEHDWQTDEYNHYTQTHAYSS